MLYVTHTEFGGEGSEEVLGEAFRGPASQGARSTSFWMALLGS